jgi:hypothetical protein
VKRFHDRQVLLEIVNEQVLSPGGEYSGADVRSKENLRCGIKKGITSGTMQKVRGNQLKAGTSRKGHISIQGFNRFNSALIHDAEMRDKTKPQLGNVHRGPGNAQPEGYSAGHIGILVREKNVVDVIKIDVLADQPDDPGEKMDTAGINQGSSAAADDEILVGLNHPLLFHLIRTQPDELMIIVFVENFTVYILRVNQFRLL